MSRISSNIAGRLESITDLITMARDVSPQAVPRNDEVLSDERIASLFLEVVSGSEFEKLPIDEYFWAEHLWELQELLEDKKLSKKKRAAAVTKWILETDEHYVLDLCGFDFYYDAILYDDVEFLFEEHNAYPLMGLALSTGGEMLANDEYGYSLEYVQPAHVLGASLMVLSSGYRLPDVELATRFVEFPMLAFMMFFFHMLPEENPFCGQLENENRVNRYYHWHEVPHLLAAADQYAKILKASPELTDLLDPFYLFRELLTFQKFG
ncbi:MAG: hypothetical protein DWQ07_17645 [Chloroflexi bacterium]|nr:MAG: hypothetical protein DWQ07_17645 [Chloroflexota bacterium]